MTYSFCEIVQASGSTPWHIRLLTKKGKKLGGGADTVALCGREVSWDLNVEITDGHLVHCCKDCVDAYKKATSGS